ncbi:MAG: hypothetical protein IBX64_11495 [Actinobacteria bacterium]|nr:hypothetical protein [Actinomycetota bacterium]
MNSKMVAAFVISVLIVGGGSFYAGGAYQSSKRPSYVPMGGQFGNMSGQGDTDSSPGRFSGQRGGAAFSGEVVEKDNKSVTIKLQDGSQKTITITESTAINKIAKGSIGDVKQGEQIVVIGTENSDGSVSANTVQIGRFGR